MACVWRQSILLLFALWLLTVDYSQGQTTGCAGMLGGIDCDGSGQSCTYTASYAVQPDDTITFTVSATTAATNWVAIGVSDDQFMPDTDIVLGAADDTNSFIQDRFATAQAEPPVDASQDITSASASRVDGVTTITFNRPRNSGDSNDISLDVCRFFLFAFGGSVDYGAQSAMQHNFGPMFRVASEETICIPTFAECIAGVVGFNQSAYSVSEAELTLEVCVDAADLIRDTTVTISATSVTTAADDFTLTDVQVALNATETQACVQIGITDDAFLEDSESFTLSLAATPPAALDPSTATVTITDNDSATIGFAETTYTVAEGDSRNLCVGVQSGTLERDVEVTLESTDGTATSTGTVDYTPPGPSLIIASGTTEECVSVDTMEDDALEGDHSFVVSLSTAVSGVNVTSTADETTVTITDDDTANVVFERTSYSVAEGGSLTDVCASVQSGTLERDVMLTVRTSDGTATSTVDYTSIDSMLTIASGSSRECIPVVATTDDDILEDDESFDISLSTADPDVNVTAASATVTITEDADNVTVAFQEPPYTIPEGASMQVCVAVVTGVLERDIMVTVSSVDDTAVEGADYTMVNSVLTLNASGDPACVDVATTGDDVLENDETFFVSLTSADSAVMFSASTATVVISNDDMVTIGFTEMTYAVAEGAMQEVRGRVLEGMIGPGVSVEVTVSSMDGTATAPADFTEVTAMWTFNDTVSEQNISVSTAEDDVLEGNQTFSVSLTTDSTDVMLDPDAAEVTITDDDTLEIAWQQPSYNVNEANSFVEVCVQLTGALERSVDITISTVPDNATADDFTTLNMAPGTITAGTDSSMCVNITIVSDAIDETTAEMFAVEFNTQDSGVTPLTGSTTVVIFDPPTLVPGQPTDQPDVDPGIDVMFTVEAMGSNLTYQWQRDMSDIADGAEYTGTATSALTVLDAREGDEGSYRCLMTNAVDSAPSEAAQLTVLDPPRITTQPSSMNNVAPGDNVTFSVVAEGLRLNYSWQFQEFELLGSDLVIGVNTPMLTIIDVEDSDMGNYRCVVSNAAGSETSDTAQLTFIGQPVIVENPMDVVVESGGTALFTCTATSNASLFFSWETTAVGVALPDDVVEGSDPAVGITSTLTLMDVTVNHRGDYYCVVENERGNKSSLLATLTVVVIEDINPPSQTVGYGVNASFNCMASGSSDLAYSWETDVLFVGNDSRRLIGTDTPTLVITNVGPDDDGTYRCTVSVSGMEIGSREAELVTEAPVFVTELPDNLTISTGETLVLMCAAMNTVGSPDLNFIWYFNSVNIALVIPRAVIESSEQDPVTRVATSNLTVPNINRDNDGQYTCQAYNRLIIEGISSISDVTVEFLPVVTLSFPDDLRRNVGLDLAVLCTAIGEPPVERIELLQNGVLVENTTGDTLSFSQSNLQLSDNGTTYICRAFNTRGNMSSSESFDVIVQDIPGQVNHSSVTVDLITFFSARLMWPEPETNNGLNLEYNVTFCKVLDGDSGCGTGPFLREASDSSIVLTDLAIRSTYQVTIQAGNDVGVGPVPSIPSNETFTFETVDEDNVILMNVNADIVTESRVVLSWEVPDIALDTPGLTKEFNVSYVRSGDDNVNSIDVPGNSLATVITELDSNAEYNFSVTVEYSLTPKNLVSAPVNVVIRTREEDFTPPTANVGEEAPGGRFIISWSRPSGFQFLVRYVVNIVRLSRRRRRQTMAIPVPRDDTNFDFQTDPFTQYMADVSGDFNVNGTTFRDPVAAPVTFTSNEQVPSEPLGLVVAMMPGFTTLNLMWNLPASPNGRITSFRVTYVPPDLTDTVIVSGNDPTFSHILVGLTPNTRYSITVVAVNGAGRGGPATTVATTDFGVVKPVIASFEQVNNQPRIRIEIDPFSTMQGELSHFVIVVAVGFAPVPGSITDAELVPFAEGRTLYVAGAFVYTGPRSFVIGDGSSRSFVSTTFINPELTAGSTYYAFVRLYSSEDETRSEDSDVPQGVVVNISDSLDPVPIIVPVALVAGLLFIVFIILVIVAIYTRRPSVVRRQLLGEGNLDSKKSRGVELRRTRIFSPVLNVGVPNVFTSACQPTTLICEASGTPAPEVSWTKDGEPLDPERFIQLADSSLFINDTDLQDEGSYVVAAVNSAGSTEQMVRVTVIRPVPPEPDLQHPSIAVGDFTEKIAILRTNDDEGLEDEYSEVDVDSWNFTSYAAKLNINKNKNRYVNIIPYDHGRVVLSLQENTPGSDYINGSYIDGYNRPNAYIATQGPIPSTFPDFWRMVWEHDSPTIIMVTNLKEEDKVKCHQYWPSYGTTTYGSLQVTLKEVENLAEYSIRTFNISPIAGQSKTQMPVREVRQFHFLVWPDHGVPQYATPLLSFRKRVVKYHPDKRGPMVIHCSAGVGRTGTFIALNHLLKQIEAEGVVDIFNLVRQMRFRRNYMVQTSAQYIFIHDAILESIMCGDTSIPAPELRQKLQQLQQLDTESQQTLMAAQFETLNIASPSDDEFDCTIAQLPDNMEKNRGKEHLPSNEYRVVLSTDNDQSDYICASFVDGYRQRNAFMTTQAPLQHTTGDFWRMVWEHKSAAIVMLTEIGEAGLDKYWPGEVKMPEVYGLYQVELASSERDVGDYITKKFKLSPVDMPQESRMVTQFHFVKWSKGSSPTTTRPMIDLIDELQRVQRKSGNGPITVHCDNGIGRTGTFCALYSVLERVKTEQVVDVFQAVKTLRIQRAGLLETLDQYEFVHKSVLQFLDSFADYQNFK